MKGAPIATSTPGMDLWRQDERTTLSEAAWLGSAFGICMHAVLSFFELWIPALGSLLVVFAPAERIAAGMHGVAPFVRWMVLLGVLATEGALFAVVLAGALREASTFLRRTFRATSC